MLYNTWIHTCLQNKCQYDSIWMQSKTFYYLGDSKYLDDLLNFLNLSSKWLSNKIIIINDGHSSNTHIKCDLHPLPNPWEVNYQVHEGSILLRIKRSLKLLWLSWKTMFCLFASLSYDSSHLNTASFSFTFLFTIFWLSIEQ